MDNNSKFGFLHTVWNLWERGFRRLAHVEPLRTSDEYLFYVSIRRFMGRSIVVDSVKLNRFDKIIELHMNNDMLFQILRDSRSIVAIGVRLLKEAHRALPVLAERVSQISDEDARVLIGITFINRSVERLGFHTFPIKSKVQHRMTSWYLRNIFRMVNPNAKSMFKSNRETFVPKMVAMSKEKLLATYGSKDTSSNA